MTTLTHPDHVGVDFSHPFAHWREAWSHLNPRHGAGVLLAALVMTVVDWSIWIDKAAKPGVGKMFAFDAFAALLLFTLTLLAWSIASHRAPADRGAQRRRLLLAIVGSAALTAAITVPLMGVLGIDQIVWEMMEKKKALPPTSLVILSYTVQYAVFSFMFLAALEVVRRRAVTQMALQNAQHEQVAIARQVLESRLAAMQAQVEPQFLFDTLVDVEALYRADAPRAADNLDRLITYLRVALPRLRETGSTVDAEIQL
ncbi:MAG: histidine kinase, partial [Burkholderiaceae bacterium]